MTWEKLNSIRVSYIAADPVKAQRRTVVVKMLAKLHVTMTSSGNVKVALHLVEVQRAIDAAAVGVAADAGRLAPLGTLLSEGDNVVDVLFAEALFVVDGLVALAGVDAALAVMAELVDALGVDPLRPLGGIAVQLGGGEDAVARGILDVDVQVGALHVDDNVEVDLHGAGDALFDGKVVRLGAAPPAADLAAHEDERYEGHGHRPLAAACRPGNIFGLCLGWVLVSRAIAVVDDEDVRNASKALTTLPLAPKLPSSR